MPLKALRHPDNPWVWCGTSLSACEACDHQCEPLEQLRFVWAYGVNGDDPDHYHNDPKSISVTETLNCPRKSVLMRLMDYAESPSALAARAHGTAIHKAYEACQKDGHSEVTLSLPLSRGYTLRGTADRLLDDGCVKDFKNMDSFRKTLDVQHEDQLSIYGDMGVSVTARLVLSQVTRKGVQEMDATYNPEALPTCIARAEQMIDALESGDASILPPRGREIKHFRARHCDYCPYEIRQRCEEISPIGGEQ